MTRSFPHLKGHPFLGNFQEYNQNRLALYHRVLEEGGDRGAILHFGPLPLFLLTKQEDIHEVLVHSSAFDISWFVRGAFKPLAQNGLLTSRGDFHKRQRKLMAPSFQPLS